jgi:LuxR family maltose regulon positive regulatory protein
MLTSVLDEFSLPLAITLTGMKNSDAIIERLREHQAFIISFNSTEKLYRYHHVFRDFLLARLSESGLSSVQQQSRLAAHYYMKAKNIVKAVPFYLKGNDQAGLMDLIEENCADFLLSDDAENLVHLIEELEPYGAFERLRICICFAYALHNTKQVVRTEAFIKELKRKFEAQKDKLSKREANLLFIEICAMSLPYAVLAFDFDLTLYYIKQLVTPHRETLVFGVSNVISMSEREFTLRDTVFGFWGRNHFHIEFWNHLEKSRELLLIAGVSRFPAFCVARAEVLYELNRIDESLRLLSGNIECAKKNKDFAAYLPAMLCLADIQKSRGNVSAAYATIDECIETLYEANAQYDAQLVYAYKSGLDLEFGDLAAVESWEESLQISPFDDVSEKSRLNLYLQIALGNVLIKTGRTALAKIQLSHLADAIEPYEDLIYKIKIQCLLCVLAFKEGSADQAFLHMVTILKIGQRHGYYRTIADLGSDILPVLELALKNAEQLEKEFITVEYIEQLVQLCRKYTQNISEYSIQNGPAIILSKKELIILSHLSHDMSLSQIADVMSFSAQTIKNYTSKIYRKLNVSGKKEALAKAKQMRII